MTYQAGHDGGAVISGGLKLELKWEPWRDGIFHSRGSSSALQMPVDGSEQEMHALRLYWLGAHLHSLQGEEYSWFVP